MDIQDFGHGGLGAVMVGFKASNIYFEPFGGREVSLNVPPASVVRKRISPKKEVYIIALNADTDECSPSGLETLKCKSLKLQSASAHT